jgi:aromatic ring-opening dioxygenase catalytic subunit (LigB family)
LTEALTGDVGEREKKLAAWEAAPAARVCHPREEHLMPLMVVAGAAGADAGIVTSLPVLSAVTK